MKLPYLFFEPKDKYPYNIDESRVSEARDSKPFDYWMYREFKGRWYPPLPREEIARRSQLMGWRKEYGIHFITSQHFEQWISAELAKPVHYNCSACDYTTTNLDALTRHSGTNSCRIRQIKLKAKENQSVYVPPHKAKHFCSICNTAFANRHVYLRHLKTQTHRDKENADPVPTQCMVCKYPFTTPLKTKRHLKTAKKCHRIALNDENLLKNWYYMVDRFRCKFDRNIIQQSGTCVPCSPQTSTEKVKVV